MPWGNRTNGHTRNPLTPWNASVSVQLHIPGDRTISGMSSWGTRPLHHDQRLQPRTCTYCSITFLPLKPSKSSILRRRWTPYLYSPANENLIHRAVEGTLRLQHHRCLQPRTCTASNVCRYNSPKVASCVVDGHHIYIYIYIYILQPMKTWSTARGIGRYDYNIINVCSHEHVHHQINFLPL